MHEFAETEDYRSGYILSFWDSIVDYKKMHSMKAKTKITLTIVTKMMLSKLNVSIQKK